MPRSCEKTDAFEHLCRDFSGPVLFKYVWWVLSKAQKEGIHTLYFLARDGFLLCRIAQLFCEKYHLDIQCRYLYCSRKALRMPSYHLIGEEAYDHLLFLSYQYTLNAFFDRADLTEDERRAVCLDCGLTDLDADASLNIATAEQIRLRLRQSPVFQQYTMEKSRAAYANAIGYFRQEGLLDQDRIALVDSGWAGSMQRSLRQLLDSAGYTGSICGFYFGMYAEPRDVRDGEYWTWYFNAKGRCSDKAAFSNNLFECLLSAPHAMTIGYALRSERYEPVMLPFTETQETLVVRRQIDTVLAWCEEALNHTNFSAFDAEREKRATRRLMQRYMFRPTSDEAAAYGALFFCDDINESYKISLADPSQVPSLRMHLIPCRVVRRLKKKSKTQPTFPFLYWSYGTIAFLPAWKKPWYRLNVFVWEWLRHICNHQG